MLWHDTSMIFREICGKQSNQPSKHFPHLWFLEKKIKQKIDLPYIWFLNHIWHYYGERAKEIQFAQQFSYV